MTNNEAAVCTISCRLQTMHSLHSISVDVMSELALLGEVVPIVSTPWWCTTETIRHRRSSPGSAVEPTNHSVAFNRAWRHHRLCRLWRWRHRAVNLPFCSAADVVRIWYMKHCAWIKTVNCLSPLILNNVDVELFYCSLCLLFFFRFLYRIIHMYCQYDEIKFYI